MQLDIIERLIRLGYIVKLTDNYKVNREFYIKEMLRRRLKSKLSYQSIVRFTSRLARLGFVITREGKEVYVSY